LLPRAKNWIRAINAQFEFANLDELASPTIPNESVRKML
jgi:hypothetical protein